MVDLKKYENILGAITGISLLALIVLWVLARIMKQDKKSIGEIKSNSEKEKEEETEVNT